MGFPGNSINELALETEELNDEETEEENEDEDNDSAIGEDEGNYNFVKFTKQINNFALKITLLSIALLELLQYLCFKSLKKFAKSFCFSEL